MEDLENYSLYEHSCYLVLTGLLVFLVDSTIISSVLAILFLLIFLVKLSPSSEMYRLIWFL